MEERVRRPHWKLVTAFSSTLAAAIFGLVLWIGSVESRKFAVMDRRVRDLIAEIQLRDASRSTLYGEAVVGNAWDDYLQAMKAVPTSPGSVQLLSGFALRKPGADRNAVEALVASHANVLVALQQGARKSHAHLPYDWEAPYAATAPRVHQFPVQQVNYLAWCQARLLFENGRHREAIELLLDLTLFGRDACMSPDNTGEMCGEAAMSIALRELQDFVLSKRLQEENLLFLEHSFENLDRVFPDRTIPLLSDAVNLGMTLLREESRGEIMHRGPEERLRHTWRWIFSSRLRAADTFLQAERWVRRAREAESLSWKDTAQVYDDIEGEVKQWKEPIVRMELGSLDLGSSGRAAEARKLRARLRLLRIATHFLATGDVLELADPFGDKLLRSVSGGVLKALSVGRNGEDDSRPKRSTAPFKDDIALEIGPR